MIEIYGIKLLLFLFLFSMSAIYYNCHNNENDGKSDQEKLVHLNVQRGNNLLINLLRLACI